jgi:serine/threonine protein kinase
MVMKEAWGRQFKGTARFRPVQKLGEGGMGSVYEADDLERGERVAIKVLHRADVDALRRFKQEYRALQDLEHPNLVRLGELHEAGGLWFFSMELVPGMHLGEFVRPPLERPARASTTSPANDTEERLGYDEARLRESFRQLAQGLHALHTAGKVHCDIKPSNVRVTPEGRVVVLDFGLVFERGRANVSDNQRVVGTAAYMAPEQARERGVCVASDWYAFGIVLYEALTGALPFSGDGLKVLMDKMHTTPSAPRERAPGVPLDLDRLCTALLQIHPEDRPSGEEVLRMLGGEESLSLAPGPHNASERPVFVGRTPELAQLHRAHEQVKQGSAAVVSIQGASGLGKSTLMSRFIAEARERDKGLIVLSGRCYERETARFKALDGVVDALATELSKFTREQRRAFAPADAQLLKRLFPVLARIDVIGRAQQTLARPRDSVDERRLMFAALRELFTALAHEHTLVIAIDDMQWADGDSLELLRALLDPALGPPPRMLVVVTAREGWSEPAGEDNRPQVFPGVLHVLELGALSSDDAALLAHELLARHGTHGVEPLSLVREAQGHPLFVAELAWLAHKTPSARANALSLDEAIWARSSALPEPMLSVLRLLAVASVPVRPQLLAKALSLSLTEVDRQVVALRIAALAKTVGSRGERKVEPYHDRIREALLARLDRELVRELHARIAPLLEQEPEADFELVAQHYLDAGERERAAALFEKAAERAEEGLAFERAALLYRARLALGRLEARERSQMYRRLAQTLVRAGRAKAAADAYFSALQGATESERVQLQNAAATCLLRSGHVTEGLAALENVLHSVGASMPTGTFQALATLIFERLRLGLTGYRVKYRGELDIPPEVLRRADALFAAAQGLSLVDGVRCAPVAAQALRASLKSGERTRVVKALASDVSRLALGGVRTLAGARRALVALHSAAEPLTEPVIRGYVLGAESTLAVSHAQFQSGYEIANAGLEILDAPGVEAQWERVYVRTFRIFSQFYLGRLREMYEEGEVALRDAEMRRDRWFASLLRIGPCSLGVVEKDLALARQLNEEGFAPWRERVPGFLFWCWFVKSVVLDLVEGHVERALSHYETHKREISLTGSWFVPMLRAHLCGYRVVGLLQKFRASGDKRDLREARHWLRKLGPENALMRGWSLLLEAQLAEAGGTGDPLALTREAVLSFKSCEAERFLRMAEAYQGYLVGGDEGQALSAGLRGYFEREQMARWDLLVGPFVPVLSGA